MSAHHRPQPGDEGILVPDRAQGGEELVEVGGVGMDDAEPTNSIAEAGNVHIAREDVAFAVRAYGTAISNSRR